MGIISLRDFILVRSRPRLNRDDALNVTMTIKNDNNNMVILTISIVFNDTIL